MYRVQFDHQDIILANATDPTTMTYFTSLLKLAISKGNSVYTIFYYERSPTSVLRMPY